MRTLFMAAGLLASALLTGTALAADPTFANIAGNVGVGGNRPTQGDQATFIYRGTRAIVPSNHGNPWPVLTLQNGVFKPIGTTAIGNQKDGHGCTAIDITNPTLNGLDGLTDLICTVGACEGQCTSDWPKRLLVQQPGGGFVDKASSTPMRQPHARGRDTAALALGSGKVVMIWGNQESPRFPALSIDRAFISDNGRIRELPLLAASGGNRANTTSKYCAALVPRTGTLPDLLFCNETRVNSYRWDGSVYRLTQPYGNFQAVDLLVADFDGDGRQDIGALRGGSFSIRRGGVTSVPVVGLTRGVNLARGDVSCDGKPDILILQSNAAGNNPVMLINNGNGLSYHRAAGTFPHPSTGNGDSATYVPVGNGRSKAAFLTSNGRFGSGPTYFVEATCH
jgi:hypothetical protein